MSRQAIDLVDDELVNHTGVARRASPGTGSVIRRWTIQPAPAGLAGTIRRGGRRGAAQTKSGSSDCGSPAQMNRPVVLSSGGWRSRLPAGVHCGRSWLSRPSSPAVRETAPRLYGRKPHSRRSTAEPRGSRSTGSPWVGCHVNHRRGFGIDHVCLPCLRLL